VAAALPAAVFSSGPATVCAPPTARPVPKGLFTVGFLARLAYEKHVLGRPVHRIVQALAADGFDVAAGTLCGALKQIAPLIAPWAFITSETTVFVMDASRSADAAAGQLASTGNNHSWRPGAAWSSPPISTRPISRWSVAGPHRRRRLGLVLGPYPAVFPAGRGRSPRGARRLVRRVDRADRGTVPGAPRARGYRTGHRRPRARPGPLAAGVRRHRSHRTLQAADAAKGLLHPAAAKVIATLTSEWDGLVRHQELPQLPLDDNSAERALRTPVIGRKNFHGSGAEWAAHLAADV
jgi:transposase